MAAAGELGAGAAGELGAAMLLAQEDSDRPRVDAAFHAHEAPSRTRATRSGLMLMATVGKPCGAPRGQAAKVPPPTGTSLCS